MRRGKAHPTGGGPAAPSWVCRHHSQGHERNLGAALLQRCTQVYRQCEFFLLYGQMSPGRGLEAFYARQGFEVLAVDGRLDLWCIFGKPGGIYADRGERLFVKRLR